MALPTRAERLRRGHVVLQGKLDDEPTFEAAWRAYHDYTYERGLPKRAVILCGPAKSGNTFLRFVYHNLLNVRLNDARETLTYRELNRCQRNIGFPHVLVDEGLFRPPLDFDYREFPLMFHAHHAYEPFWSGIGDVVFVVRNPLDTAVSYWYHNIDNNVEKRGSITIDDYALVIIEHWISVYTASAPYADHVIFYEDLMRFPEETVAGWLKVFGIPFTPAQLSITVAMSSINSIRKMEDESGQQHGHMVYDSDFHMGTPPTWHANARFARSGEIGQWQKALKTETVREMRRRLDARGVDTSVFQFD